MRPGWADGGVEAYHRAVAARGSTPMDETVERSARVSVDSFPARVLAALEWARSLGLVEVWEAGLRDWKDLAAVLSLRAGGRLPVRVRVLVASGIASPTMQRTGDAWVEVVGVKFYADGWVGPRTCACSRSFADRPHDGVLFLDGDALAARSAPYFESGWTVATHAIGDRAIEAVLDGYERAAGGDRAALRKAAPRIEHAQVLRPDLVARMAELGVVACIQPSFAVSDAPDAAAALDGFWPDAYRWDRLIDAGVRVVAGSDYPIETLDPLAGLRDLVAGTRDRADPVAPTLDVDRALAIMTLDSSGSTVLSGDPRSVDPPDIASLGVVDTIPAS